MSALATWFSIAGAGAALFFLMTAEGLLTARAYRRALDQMIAEASVELGIQVDAINTAEGKPEFVRWLTGRLSSDRLANRLSDFCGILLAGWGWIRLGVILVFFAVVAWNAVKQSPHDVVGIWFVVIAWIVSGVPSLVFFSACKLLTGRCPGCASSVRKHLDSLA